MIQYAVMYALVGVVFLVYCAMSYRYPDPLSCSTSTFSIFVTEPSSMPPVKFRLRRRRTSPETSEAVNIQSTLRDPSREIISPDLCDHDHSDTSDGSVDVRQFLICLTAACEDHSLSELTIARSAVTACLIFSHSVALKVPSPTASALKT